jgi:hypothetical protein
MIVLGTSANGRVQAADAAGERRYWSPWSFEVALRNGDFVAGTLSGTYPAITSDAWSPLVLGPSGRLGAGIGTVHAAAGAELSRGYCLHALSVNCSRLGVYAKFISSSDFSSWGKGTHVGGEVTGGFLMLRASLAVLRDINADDRATATRLQIGAGLGLDF